MPTKSYSLRASDSSDNARELFDVVDEHDHVIGQARRSVVHSDPSFIHRSVQVLVFDRRGRLLLQRRSQSKDLYPGYYCTSASGHVMAGDTYANTAERELREELGVELPLTYFGRVLVRSEVETEITALFAARADGPFTFHPTETDGGSFFSRAEVRQGITQGTLPLTPALRSALKRLESQAASKLAFSVGWRRDNSGMHGDRRTPGRRDNFATRSVPDVYCEGAPARAPGLEERER